MSKKNISQEKIIQAFMASAFDKSAGASSLADVSEILEIKKASLYNHFESRDAMYTATIDYCEKEIEAVSFIPEKTIEGIKGGKTVPSAVFKKLITRYTELFENETENNQRKGKEKKGKKNGKEGKNLHSGNPKN